MKLTKPQTERIVKLTEIRSRMAQLLQDSNESQENNGAFEKGFRRGVVECLEIVTSYSKLK